MDYKIDAVMIDTSTYHKNQCDFEGITKSIIPMLLQLLKANNITLLTHPVLESEIQKHIGESEVVCRVGHLQTALKKYNKQLQMIDISTEELVERLCEVNIEKRLRDKFSSFYQRAISVPYVSAREVFKDYFNANPPFSATGNKKAEFPDAFILKGVIEYCKNNMNSTVLVISDDLDWKRTLDGNKQIKQVDSFETAMVLLWEQLNDKSDLYQMLISQTESAIYSEIADAALSEAFCIDGIDTAEEVDVENISVISIDDEIVPLEVTQNSVLLQMAATLSVDGRSEFFDENRSAWDKEDRCYYFCAYTQLTFQNALAEVDCEIRIDFADDGSLSQVELASVKLINKWDISLNLDEADTTENDVTDYGEDDYRAEQAEAAEEFYKH
jgi:hypothetical protein